jgi:trimeric autotransporter adhesin
LFKTTLMKKLFTSKLSIFACTILMALSASFFYFGNPFSSWANEQEEYEEEHDGYDGAAEAAEFEFRRTLDPALGYVPSERLWNAIEKAAASKELAANRPESFSDLLWTERGPNTDEVGPTNGNKRGPVLPDGSVTGGRVRAIWADLKDATKKTVFVAGVTGGMWKTTDITATNPNWTLINDKLSNLGITSICQSPLGTQDTFYACTGERFGGEVQGQGIFKSVDGGSTWALLPNTAPPITNSYKFCTKIACDPNGHLYVGTSNGFYRSTNGGNNWRDITPDFLTSTTCDFEISSTGRLHIAVGYRTDNAGLVRYRYTDNPSEVATGTWTAATTPFTYPLGIANGSQQNRVEMACSGNTLYAAPSNSIGKVTEVFKSTDGGVNWTTLPLTATNVTDLNGTGASSQGWYSLAIDIDPSNADNVIIGNLNTIKSTNGGTSWAKLSEWAETFGQYLHADIQGILWYDNGNKLIFACDGGIFYSSDKGTAIQTCVSNSSILARFTPRSPIIS